MTAGDRDDATNKRQQQERGVMAGDRDNGRSEGRWQEMGMMAE